MKRTLAFLAVFLILCSAGCADKSKPASTTPAPTPTPSLRDESMPKKLLVSDVESLPLATDAMTTEQLRQLCLDYFELQLSFQWIPGMDISFLTTNYKRGTQKNLKTDEVYGGIPYQGGGASGNLYRWLEYYDETTGIFDFETALAENGGYGDGAALDSLTKDENGNVTYMRYKSLMTLFNQCSFGAFWGWGRAINSISGGMTCDITAYNGFIPLGCYNYGYDHEGQHYGITDIKAFGSDGKKEGNQNPLGYDTDDVIMDLVNEGGYEAIYECYAQCKPADLLVDAGHLMMVKSVTLYKASDGTVDYTMSSVTVLEQIEGWGSTGTLDGKTYKVQGGVDRTYSFEYLRKEGYIPFTFAELLDENDPQDKKHLDYYLSYAEELTSVRDRYDQLPFEEDMNGIGVEKARILTTVQSGPIRYADFTALAVGSNYTVSDVFVTVKDPQGNPLLTNIYRADYPNIREVSMGAVKSTWEKDSDGNYLTLCHGLEALANGENTVEVSVRISTGETLTAFSGTLLPNEK